MLAVFDGTEVGLIRTVAYYTDKTHEIRNNELKLLLTPPISIALFLAIWNYKYTTNGQYIKEIVHFIPVFNTVDIAFQGPFQNGDARFYYSGYKFYYQHIWTIDCTLVVVWYIYIYCWIFHHWMGICEFRKSVPGVLRTVEIL